MDKDTVHRPHTDSPPHTHTHAHNTYRNITQPCKGSILPFVTWMDIEDTMEVKYERQRKTNTICLDLYVESKNKQMK